MGVVKVKLGAGLGCQGRRGGGVGGRVGAAQSFADFRVALGFGICVDTLLAHQIQVTAIWIKNEES